MTDTLALEHLFDSVSAKLTADGVAATNVFGWRAPSLAQVYAARITWVPGDLAGTAGALAPARNPGNSPRSLATLKELFTVTITASDPAAPDDERAQYKMTRLLRDMWHRAMYLTAHGAFSILSERWIIDRKERRHGAALRIVCSVDATVPDEAPTPDTQSLFARAAVAVGADTPSDVVAPDGIDLGL